MSMTYDLRCAVEGVIARHFTDRLQSVYAELQRELGIAGDISPGEVDDLERFQLSLARLVGGWLAGSLTFDQAEAMGMDGTLRDHPDSNFVTIEQEPKTLCLACYDDDCHTCYGERCECECEGKKV